jgi:hypothetical protein
LTEEEIKEYELGYDENNDYKDWGWKPPFFFGRDGIDVLEPEPKKKQN